MAKSSGNRGGSRGSTRGSGKSGDGGKGAGWPAKTGNKSGRGRYNAPPKRK